MVTKSIQVERLLNLGKNENNTSPPNNDTYSCTMCAMTLLLSQILTHVAEGMVNDVMFWLSKVYRHT